MRKAARLDIMTAVFLLGIVCTAVTNLFYLKFVSDIRPSSAYLSRFGSFFGIVFVTEL
jgi:hypothetical protein